jgi:hypothetical protein
MLMPMPQPFMNKGLKNLMNEEVYESERSIVRLRYMLMDLKKLCYPVLEIETDLYKEGIRVSYAHS